MKFPLPVNICPNCPHSRHHTVSAIDSTDSKRVVFFWDTVPCGLYMNDRFGGTYHLHLQDGKSADKESSVLTGGQDYKASYP
jgi:hypothetical protein